MFLSLAEGFQSWMWKGLTFVLPFLVIAYVSTMFVIVLDPCSIFKTMLDVEQSIFL